MTRLRMCIHCRGRFHQNDLLRLQIIDNMLVRFTNTGRSFYLCRDCVEHKNCIKTICKVNKINNNENLTIFLKEIIHKWAKSNKKLK